MYTYMQRSNTLYIYIMYNVHVHINMYNLHATEFFYANAVLFSERIFMNVFHIVLVIFSWNYFVELILILIFT